MQGYKGISFFVSFFFTVSILHFFFRILVENEKKVHFHLSNSIAFKKIKLEKL